MITDFKLYIGQCIPIRVKDNQPASFYGKVIGYNVGRDALIVTDRDNNSKKEFDVRFGLNRLGNSYFVTV